MAELINQIFTGFTDVSVTTTQTCAPLQLETRFRLRSMMYLSVSAESTFSLSKT